jgi:pimeloyl-ACP methyl ester carboxylesterase
MTFCFDDTISVSVDGHAICVHRSGPDPGSSEQPVVVALHGITASAMAWSQVPELLGGHVTLLCPDMRGRGASCDHPGPYGIETHASDVIAICDQLGIQKAIVAGHSMGAYVAAVCALKHPARIRAVVMVDGGLPLPVPPDKNSDEIIDEIVGPAVGRLKMTWDTLEAYYSFWKNHPALSRAEDWTSHIEAYIDYDVRPDTSPIRSRVSESAVRFDGDELITRTDLSSAARDCSQPIWLLRAPRGMLDDPDSPLIPEDAALELVHANPHVHLIQVPDVNHYTILMGHSGAAMVAGAIRTAAGAD